MDANVVSHKSNIPFPKYKGKSTDDKSHIKKPDIVLNKSIYTPICFWTDDPAVLFQTFEIIPNSSMSEAERLNAMTRVIIIISAIMFLMKFDGWWTFLLLGIIVVIILWNIIKPNGQSYKSNEFLRKPLMRTPIKIITPIKSNNNINLISK